MSSSPRSVRIEDHAMNDDTTNKPTAIGTLPSPLFPVNELLALEITVAIMPLFEAKDIQINDIPEKIRRIVLDASRRQHERIAQTGRPMIKAPQARSLDDLEWTHQLDEWKLTDFMAETAEPSDPLGDAEVGETVADLSRRGISPRRPYNTTTPSATSSALPARCRRHVRCVVVGLLAIASLLLGDMAAAV